MNERESSFIKRGAEFMMPAYEVRARTCLQDPVAYLRDFRHLLLESGFDVVDVGLQSVSELDEIHAVSVEKNLFTENKPLQTFFELGQYSESGLEALFTLLRSAGFTEEELTKWIGIINDKLEPQQQQAFLFARHVLREVFECDV